MDMEGVDAMRNSFDDLYEGQRFERKSKRRKLKRMIAFVMIGIIALTLFLVNKVGQNESVSTAPSDEPVANSEQTKEPEDKMGEAAGEQTTTEEDNENNDSDNPTSSMEQNEHEDLTTEQSENDNSDSNVIETIENEWQPVGTEQEEPHVTKFDKESQDWQEMIVALETATGLSKDDMIVWWLGNDGTPEGAISTVSSQGQEEYYRVYLKWVENEGWMPTKLERLKENDRASNNDDEDDTRL
jgi:cytoskeletal protein RodZ